MNETESTTANNDCDAVRRLGTPYLDGELDPDRQATVDAHLVACNACREHFEHEREFDAFLRRSLQAPVRDAGGSMLEGRVVAALQACTRPSRTWPRVLGVAALWVLGILLGAFGATWYWQPTSGGTALPAHLDEFSDIAREVMPDPRVAGGYDEAAADYHRLFPNSELPRPDSEKAPAPRLFGSASVDGDDVHWVVYCTGKAGFPERFVLLTARASSLGSAMPGLQRLEMDVDDLRVLIWRDRDQFRMLITRREADWARQQYTALVEA